MQTTWWSLSVIPHAGKSTLNWRPFPETAYDNHLKKYFLEILLYNSVSYFKIGQSCSVKFVWKVPQQSGEESWLVGFASLCLTLPCLTNISWWRLCCDRCLSLGNDGWIAQVVSGFFRDPVCELVQRGRGAAVQSWSSEGGVFTSGPVQVITKEFTKSLWDVHPMSKFCQDNSKTTFADNVTFQLSAEGDCCYLRHSFGGDAGACFGLS